MVIGLGISSSLWIVSTDKLQRGPFRYLGPGGYPCGTLDIKYGLMQLGIVSGLAIYLSVNPSLHTLFDASAHLCVVALFLSK